MFICCGDTRIGSISKLLVGTTEIRKMMEVSYVKQSISQITSHHFRSNHINVDHIKSHQCRSSKSMLWWWGGIGWHPCGNQSISPQQDLRYFFNKISNLNHTNYIRTIVDHHNHHQTRNKAYCESVIVIMHTQSA